MSFRLTCIEVPTESLDLSSDISVKELKAGSDPMPRHIWVEPTTQTIHWSKSRQADADDNSDISTLQRHQLMSVKSESERIVVILAADHDVHRFEFDDMVAKEHFLS